ncbi:MAG: transglutaminase domain-containing protein [Candidatus Hydrogenedens sp.]|jgi:hypothetical protein|nr:transglutaminase domain-containing protein [Candidatus Hydrogenedens sp.]
MMTKWQIMAGIIMTCSLVTAETLDITPYLGDNWYGLYFNGEKVGYLVKRITVNEREEVEVLEDARFRVTMSGAKQGMSIMTKRSYAKDGKLLSIDMEMQDPAQSSSFHALVQGDEMVMKSALGGAVREESFPRPQESLNDALRDALWIRSNPEPGAVLNFSVFEPMYQKEVMGMSRIAGVEERIFNGVSTKIYEVHSVLDLMDIESTSFVAEDGTTVEDLVSDVFTMRLEPEDSAKDVDYTVDTMVSNAVILPEGISDARSRPWLRLRLTGPLREAHLFNDIRQHMALLDDQVDFYAEKTDLSLLDIPTLPLEDPELLRHTRPSAYIQSDDPRLIEKAREIVGDETNILKASQKICSWVYGNMKSVYSARLSNALDALESLEGDCTEYTVLFVGLACAAGIPAKISAGLIYVEGARPGFYFHQWATVWMGEWIDVDPAFNQIPVDVTHIKLAEGDLFRQARILPLIGRLAISLQDEPLNREEIPDDIENAGEESLPEE